MGSRLNLIKVYRSFWQAVRELSGDDGYERYLTQHAAVHHDTRALSRGAWFARQQQQKWAGIKRCC